MPLLRPKTKHREDIVSMTLSEIVIIFLFFCLILLGSLFQIHGLKEGEATATKDQGGTNLQGLLDTLRLRDRQIAGLEIRIGELERSLADAEDFTGTLRIELGEVAAELQVKSATLIALRVENEALSDQIAMLMSDNNELATQLARAIEGQRAAEKVLQDLNGKYDFQLVLVQDKEAEIENLKNEILILSGDNDKLFAERKELNDKYDLLFFSANDAIVEAEKRRLIILGLEGDVLDVSKKLDRAQLELDTARYELAQRPKHDLDALVTLDAQAGYTFQTSKAEITKTFRNAFGKGENGEISGLEQVQSLLQGVDASTIEAIEVIGHTDEQRFRTGSFDRLLLDYVNSDRDAAPAAKNNLELGMIRAAAAAIYLRGQLKDERNDIPAEFRNIPVIPMTAGELLLRNGELSGGVQKKDDPQRRRVEIRLRSKPSNNQ